MRGCGELLATSGGTKRSRLGQDIVTARRMKSENLKGGEAAVACSG